MNDAQGVELKLGDKVAYATNTIPGRSTHAVLKIGSIYKIAEGKGGEPYVVVRVIRDGFVDHSTPIRESRKIVKLS